MSIKRDLKALAAQIAAKIEELPEDAPPWWETRQPPYRLKPDGAVVAFYNAHGSPRLTAPTQRAHTPNAAGHGWDVFEVRGALLRVTDFRDTTRADWYVKAETVQPA